nr:hypothetical protein [Tanacetum cinerariifolium]
MNRYIIPLRPNLEVLQIGIKIQGYREPAFDEELEEPIEDQPLPVDASPTALLPGYIADSNPEEDEKDPKEDSADYHADGGDNDDNVEKDEADEEVEEHLALADPSVVPIDDPVPMSVKEIERVVAQQVANAIEAISIYETKTNMARKSMSQTERQEDKVAENANNKRKWEAPATARNQRTRTCYECGSLRHYKSECLIVKFQKCVDMIHGGVRASKPTTMQDAIKIVTKLMNKKISTLAERQAKNKKKLDNTYKNNQNQQQPNKRPNTGRAYTVRHGEKKHYSGSKPFYSKCNYHHDCSGAPKCHQCNKFGHLARDCISSTNANTTDNQKGTGASQKATCYEYGNQGHYRKDFSKRKNQNHENQIKSTKARGVMHAFGGGETEQDLNNIEDEIEA